MPKRTIPVMATAMPVLATNVPPSFCQRVVGAFGHHGFSFAASVEGRCGRVFERTD
jgi:hypothetical protein